MVKFISLCKCQTRRAYLSSCNPYLPRICIQSSDSVSLQPPSSFRRAFKGEPLWGGRRSNSVDPQPDSEVVVKKCGGCKGEMPPDILLPNRASIHGPFVLNNDNTNLLIKDGACDDPDKPTDTCEEDGCTLNASIHIFPHWPHNGNETTWEVRKNGTTIKGPTELKEVTVILNGPYHPAGPYKWDCGTTTEIVVKWKKNGANRSRISKLVCTPCEKK